MEIENKDLDIVSNPASDQVMTNEDPIDQYSNELNAKIGFARTLFIRSNEKLHEEYESRERQKQTCLKVIESFPAPKENLECQECIKLYDRINQLSIILYNTEQNANEIYLEMKEQLAQQFDLNKKLVQVMENTQALAENEKAIKEKIEAKEAELKKLEASRLADIKESAQRARSPSNQKNQQKLS